MPTSSQLYLDHDTEKGARSGLSGRIETFGLVLRNLFYSRHKGGEAARLEVYLPVDEAGSPLPRDGAHIRLLIGF